jgi:hypothetical protein
MRRESVLVIFVLAALALSAVTVAYGSQSTLFSGYETSAGRACGAGRTCGTSFSGWTNPPGTTGWTLQSNGGSWTTSVDYTGTPGINQQVNITGGAWSWIEPTGTQHRGRVTGGTVTWPATLDTSVPGSNCGPGVAVISATIRQNATPGTIGGCLDDTHLLTVFPPHIWGTLTLGS